MIKWALLPNLKINYTNKCILFYFFYEIEKMKVQKLL